MLNSKKKTKNNEKYKLNSSQMFTAVTYFFQKKIKNYVSVKKKLPSFLLK